LYKIPANTLFTGKNLIYVPECHSTNSLALELAQQPLSIEGSVVITDHQTAGRGQRGNAWEAAKGENLTFSLMLKPAFLPLKQQFSLNIFTALAIRDFLQSKTDVQVKIKWPNDILINGSKICGILIENQIQAQQVSLAVIGIGININQNLFKTPTATSLSLVTGKKFDLPAVLHELLEKLESRYLQLRNGNFLKLKSEYLAALYWQGEDHTFRSNDVSFEGKISGIDEIGKLVLETNQGKRTFDVKEISYVQ
jgi:BirA family biotin operon repressor/biotin-[acetyl-CoA-carboxylase] ligase